MIALRSILMLIPLVRDTFRQARASGIGAMMLAVTAICSVLCLSVKISGDVSLHDKEETVYFLPTPELQRSTPEVLKEIKSAIDVDPEYARSEGIETVRGRVTLAFGAISFPMTRERDDAVRFLETLLAGGVAGTFGLLLTLVWTAGFLPTFLNPRAISVLLAKPVSRTHLLLGKYGSVVAFVGLQVVIFVLATWLCLGVSTHVWDTVYLWSIPLLLLQFAVFYGFSVLMAVATRSTVSSVFGTVLFWLLSWGINYGYVMARSPTLSKSLPPAAHALTSAAYWISPKPIDASVILYNTLDATNHFEKPQIFQLVETSGSFSPAISLASSLMMTIALLAIATHEFNAKDY